ncbi:chromosome partition protein MukE [Pedobacter sp. MC2016-05]|uniref:chromosome partition protein MukE n=1 Tax=Pedobacter sp. MC2016-05 TaxID=2994474 RepID=UPI00224701B8|nr:chromosome partition protein MukE [Pedobacter sp. MC2016-05]MCX2476921.1 chromosome partition protein MukE [Pedobacter sp. MC2016-05]
MEDQNFKGLDYSFLMEKEVEKIFANLNITLLQGRHIDQSDYTIFSVIQKFEQEWKLFYEKLYKINLVADVFDGSAYYYLDFFENGKGGLSDQSRYRELSETQTIIGLILLDLYYTRYFEERKMISWSEIKDQIMESDHQEAYKRILFGDIRGDYDEKEWSSAENKFRSAIVSFDKLGWVSKHSLQQDELLFEIHPAIHRLAKLYSAELEDFDAFSEMIKSRREQP